MALTRRPRGIAGADLLRWMLGRGVRKPSGCLEWPGSAKDTGYGHIKMAGRPRRVHRVVFELVTEAPAPPAVRHRCDNPACFEPSHLVGGDQQANVADAMARGRTARGPRLPHTKLTDEQVRAIRSETRTHAAVAKDYGVSPSTIGLIRRGQRWEHVT